MNKADDGKRFAQCLMACAEIYGKDVGAGAMNVWWMALERFEIEKVETAFRDHMTDSTTGKFMPRPADILAQLEASDGRPNADEAWSMIPHDEGGTTVWTAEMAAAFGCCVDLIDSRDASAARMAFRSAYEREVREARQAGKPVEWTVSLGTDASRRTGALENAVRKGRIGARHALKLLPDPDASPAILALAGGALKRLTA